VTPAQLRSECLALSGAEETFPFGPETSVFKVGGKMFALAQLERKPLKVSVKCEPDLAEQLRGTYAEIEPGYHLNKRHWLTITLGGAASDELARELVAGSYELVASRPARISRSRAT
jgi:predicted DNA-binding protein (MmcQ/YjbR family)